MKKEISKKSIKVRMASALIAVLMMTSILTLTSCNVGPINGKDGADGKSAYEIAVDNGFVGSEAEWLASLTSQLAADGAQGSDAGDTRVYELFAESYEKAIAEGYSGTFVEYLNENLSTGVSENSAVSNGLLSSVIVYCVYQVRQSSFPFGGSSVGTAASAGSGVIYQLDKSSGSAYIITNYHVVYNSQSTTSDKISDDIKIYLYGNQTTAGAIEAHYIGGSMNYDIAVLRVENSEILKNSIAKAVEVADSNDIMVGQKAIAIGNAEGDGISATEGVISVDSEYIQMTALDGLSIIEYRVMRIDTAINSGNSGGGLFDSEGRLIGIVNAKIADTSVEGIGYAIPSSIAIGAAQNIIDNYDGQNGSVVKKCTVGITLEAISSSAVYDAATQKVSICETISVSEVGANTVATGKLNTGDIIKSVTVAGRETNITRMFQIVDALLYVREGETVTIKVERNGEELSFEFTFNSGDLTAYG